MAEESPKNKPVLTKFLRPLGIIGVDRIDAVVLAAIASEVPLLLIGAHGTAKSLLLTRISEALGLEFRHYNASLLNYDDLVGYPLPDASGGLKFVETPASTERRGLRKSRCATSSHGGQKAGFSAALVHVQSGGNIQRRGC